ncbi:uncharacterized protein LOC126799943 [Argentina anserina]|uniref:uncharacterized protein LOC126799943 n=1 Tax=Argentina anserina TaxID=57926 RepID=UPI0021763B49|nr:uncharacterized protein LOC126799943 [Potentilla anserina]
MDGGGGRYVAYGGGGGQEKTIINRIMLRFRPIAPKPVPGVSSSGGTVPETDNRSLYNTPSRRVKRRNIRAKKRLKSNRSSTADAKTGMINSTAVTLQLLPGEASSRDGGEVSGIRSWLSLDQKFERTPDIQDHLTSWLNTRPFNGWTDITKLEAGSDRGRLVEAAPVPVVESRVTVESVTDTCMDVRGLGYTDVEKVRSLEKDTCPGFVSDGFNRVQWVNEAYKKMVRQGRDEQSPEVRVWLVVKAELPENENPAFSCRVKLQHTWQNKKCSKMVVPCDVWRMVEGGKLAWRLDMKAALSLGL